MASAAAAPSRPAPSTPARPLPVPSTTAEALRTLRANPLTLAGFVLVFVIFGAAVVVQAGTEVSWLFGRRLSVLPYDPNAIGTAILAQPSLQHLLGTDNLGRDVFSRVLAALPLDLGIGLVITLAALVVGGGLGLVAGYWDRPGTAGGILSAVILRVTDIFLAFPSLVLALALAAILGRNLNATLIALVATWWPYYVRLVRGEVLSIKHQGYVPAARVAGVSEVRILFRHILRNLLEPLTVYVTLDIGTVLVTFSTIGFVGIALPSSIPEWGSMVQYYRGLLPGNYWPVLAPGAAIFVTVLALSLLGDGLRDVLDPRSRRAFARELATPVRERAQREPGAGA